MNTKRFHEREEAYDILLKNTTKGTFSHVLIREALDRHADVSQTQRSFLKRLCEGTIERRIQLDHLIDEHCRQDPGKLPAGVRVILQMAVYQILYMDSVPDSAACNEAVKLAKKRGFFHQAGFINGMLRTIIREQRTDRPMENRGNEAEKQKTRNRKESLSIRYSMPEWIISLWENAFSAEKTEKLLQSLLEIRPVTIRLDERMTEKERNKLLRDMEKTGVKVTPGRWFPYAARLSGTSDLRSLPGFSEGKWTVQDESSMMVAEAAGIRGGETILDVCAAPGGKSMHCALKLEMLSEEGKGQVIACDIDGSKVVKIAENAGRMGLKKLRTIRRDAGVPDPVLFRTADILLCDVPCSGLGVMGKKRDIKYHATPEGIRELRGIQRKILRNAVQYLKPNGTLIYSTCTINPAENEEQADFIEKELGMQPEDLSDFLPAALQIRGNRIQLLPDEHGTDGFFIARFRKTESV